MLRGLLVPALCFTGANRSQTLLRKSKGNLFSNFSPILGPDRILRYCGVSQSRIRRLFCRSVSFVSSCETKRRARTNLSPKRSLADKVFLRSINDNARPDGGFRHVTGVITLLSRAHRNHSGHFITPLQGYTPFHVPLHVPTYKRHLGLNQLTSRSVHYVPE